MITATERLPRTVLGLLVAACVVIVIAGLRLASPILAPVLFAITLAILFTPMLRRLEGRGLSTPLALLVMIIGMVVFFGGVLLIVYFSLLGLQEQLPVYQALLSERLGPLAATLEDLGLAPGGMPEGWVGGDDVVNAMLGAISGILSSAVGIVFFLFTLILLLIESANLGRKARAGMGTDSVPLRRFFAFCREIQQQYRIQTFSNFLSACVLTLEFLLFRIDFALLWGFLAFILGYIPNVGLIIACLPAVLIAFILHGAGTAAVVLIVGIILNAAMDNIVTPRFMKSGLQLPVLFSFLSFILWSWVFGYLGALIAIPATLFLRALLSGSRDTQLLANVMGGEAADAGDERVGP